MENQPPWLMTYTKWYRLQPEPEYYDFPVLSGRSSFCEVNYFFAMKWGPSLSLGTMKIEMFRVQQGVAGPLPVINCK